MILPWIFLFLQACIAILFLFLVLAFITGAPFVPTKNTAAETMIRLAAIRPGMQVYDLGSGDGRLLRLAQRKGARAVGFEINPFLVLFSKFTTDTRWKNFWHADIHDADVVFIYLLPWKMDRLAEKLKKECKKGTIIVSNSFVFPGWKILRQDTVNHIYVFRI